MPVKVRQIMTPNVVSVEAGESVEVAARLLARHNIGALTVRDQRGGLCGIVTDRDLVTRCIAANRLAGATRVKDVMTAKTHTVSPEMDASAAAHLMGRLQVRRLPVVEQGRICGMVTLGDLTATDEGTMDAADALAQITDNLSERQL